MSTNADATEPGLQEESFGVRWAMIDAELSTASPQKRHELYQSRENQCQSRYKDRPEECKQNLRMLYRLRAGDVEVSQVANWDEQMDFLQRMFHNGDWDLIQLVPGENLSLVNRMILATHHNKLTLREEESLGPWLSARGEWSEEKMIGRQPFAPARDPDVGLVSLLWPPFLLENREITDAECFDELRWHLTALSTLRCMGIRIIPRKLQEGLFKQKWMRRQIRLGNTSKVLELLTCLFHWVPGKEHEQPVEYYDLWSPQAVDALFEDYAEDRELLLNAIAGHVQEMRNEFWWVACILGTHYRNPALCQAVDTFLSSQEPPIRETVTNHYGKAFLDSENAVWEERFFSTSAILKLFGQFLSHEGGASVAGFVQTWEAMASQIHSLLRTRGDYVEILKDVDWTPPLPEKSWNAEENSPSDVYIQHIRIISLSSQPGHIVNTVKILLDLKETVAIRNRSLKDALSLLTRGEIACNDWFFVNVVDLVVTDKYDDMFSNKPTNIDTPPAMRALQANLFSDTTACWSKLNTLIAEARKETPDNFEDLCEMLMKKRKKAPDWLNLDRFYYYLPYLTAGLGAGNEQYEMAHKRLGQYKLLASQCDLWMGDEIMKVGENHILRWWSKQSNPLDQE